MTSQVPVSEIHCPPLDEIAETYARANESKTLDKDVASLRAEYLVAVDVIKLLSDLRFRCLVFVTALTAVASALLSKDATLSMTPALAILGLVATLGITIYELRNTQFYELAVNRAKVLEEQIRNNAGSRYPGLFRERPNYTGKTGEPLRFLLIPVKHDIGLALIYGTALGAWMYLASHGILSQPVPAGLQWPTRSAGSIQIIAALLGIVVGVASGWMLIHHDGNRLNTPQPVPEAVAASTQPITNT